jgi:hypothetical protein
MSDQFTSMIYQWDFTTLTFLAFQPIYNPTFAGDGTNYAGSDCFNTLNGLAVDGAGNV